MCRKAGTLLVLDEVQTGLGRTGELFALAREPEFVPDVLCLAKALGGSLLPIGATLTRAELQKKAYGSMERFDLHSSTFGGNSLACAAGLETLAILEDEGLVANARERGAQLLTGLRERLDGHPFVRDVRGQGLLVAVELGPTDETLVGRLAPGLVRLVSQQMFGQWAALCLLERGVICQPASQQWDVLKIEPPLTIAAAQIDEAIDAVVGVLEQHDGLTGILNDVSRRVGSQLLKGWSF